MLSISLPPLFRLSSRELKLKGLDETAVLGRGKEGRKVCCPLKFELRRSFPFFSNVKIRAHNEM